MRRLPMAACHSSGLLKGRAGAEPVRVMSAASAANSVKMLRGVVTDGTTSMGEVTGYAVAGKRVQINPMPGRYEKDKVIATFASIFRHMIPNTSWSSPWMNQRIPQAAKRRTTGWTAVPVAAEIIRRIAPLMGLRPEIEADDLGDITQVSWDQPRRGFHSIWPNTRYHSKALGWRLMHKVRLKSRALR